jgi:hypothetical protein
MALSDRPSRAELRRVVREELLDPDARFWSDSELDVYLQEWLDTVQDHLELCWATSTTVTSTTTFTLSVLDPLARRLEAVYWNGVRLDGRTEQDLDVLDRDWRSVDPSVPRAVYQFGSEVFVLWPAPATEGTMVLEHPRLLTFEADDTACPLPPWTRYSATPYCCYRALQRHGPAQDLPRASRYKAAFLRAVQTHRRTYNAFLPTRYPQLRPGGSYEADILQVR